MTALESEAPAPSHAALPVAVMPHIALEVSYLQASTCQPEAWNVDDEAHICVGPLATSRGSGA